MRPETKCLIIDLETTVALVEDVHLQDDTLPETRRYPQTRVYLARVHPPRVELVTVIGGGLGGVDDTAALLEESRELFEVVEF